MHARLDWVVAAGLLVSACGEKVTPAVIEKDEQKSSSKAVAGVPQPLKTNLSGMALTDRVDVGNEPDERNHSYVIDQPTYLGSHEFELQSGSYLESGRATKSFEVFRVKVEPWRDHLLVKMFDSLSKDQKVKVLVEGREAGDWALPNGSTERYAEASFPIPAELIGDRSEITLRINYADGTPDTNSFLYWVYAKGGPAIAAPLKTDVRDMLLTDRLDVGDEESEAAHQYAIDKAVYAGTHDFLWTPSKTSYRETLRATQSFESFRLKVTPGVDHLLIKAIDTISKDQKVRVLVDGKPLAAAWSLPNGPERYDEGTLEIPAQVIGRQEEITVRVEFISASIDTNSLEYWLYAKQRPVAQGPR